MDGCIFCQVKSPEISSRIVYEDDLAYAILDKHPIQPVHVLVIPKQHQPDFYKLSDDVYTHLMSVVKKLAEVVNTFSQPKKVGLIVAGWDVPHAHVHIVPMHDYHDITTKSAFEGKRADPTPAELSKVSHEMRSFLV